MPKPTKPAVNVGKIRTLQLGPTNPTPGSMLKKPKPDKKR